MTDSALHKAGALALMVVMTFAVPATAKLVVPPDRAPADHVPSDYHGVTVILAGGWEIPGLTVRWSADQDGLWVFRTDGARRLYRPEELVGLQDAGGRDLTREVLPPGALSRLAVTPGQPVVPPGRTPSLPPTEVGGKATAQKPKPPSGAWRFLLGIEAGWGKPHDTDFLDSVGGLSLAASVRLQLGGGLYLAGGYDRQSLPMAGYAAVYPEDDMDFPNPPTMTEEGRLRGFWAGLALLSPADGPEAARFYLEGGIGRYEVFGMPVQNPEDAYLGYHAGVGFLIPLGAAVALDLGARGTHVVNLDLGYGDDSHTVAAFRAGLTILAR